MVLSTKELTNQLDKRVQTLFDIHINDTSTRSLSTYQTDKLRHINKSVVVNLRKTLQEKLKPYTQSDEVIQGNYNHIDVGFYVDQDISLLILLI